MTRILLIALLSTLCSLAEEAAWPGVKFSEVRAFAWPNDKSTEAVILDGMSVKEGAINPKGTVLTPEQAKTLIAAVTGKHPDYPVAMCHNPHNAFVFYNDAKKPVAYVEICFGCGTHRIEPVGFASEINMVAIAALFDTHKLPMGEYADLASYKKSVDALQKRMKEGGYAD